MSKMQRVRRRRVSRRRGHKLGITLALAAVVALLWGAFSAGGGYTPQRVWERASGWGEEKATPVQESLTILVNKQNLLPASYVPSDLTQPDVPFVESALQERRQLRREAARALERLFAAAGRQGLSLVAVSGYRSYQSQLEIYNRRSREAGAAHVEQYIAKPGSSEHQTGLAMDVGCPGCMTLEETFANTPEGVWLAQHAHEYGFVIRYPSDQEDITGYAWEPWHLRYLGLDSARQVFEQGLVLETFVNQDAA